MQGSPGAHFYQPVAEALSMARLDKAKVSVLFKGFVSQARIATEAAHAVQHRISRLWKKP